MDTIAARIKELGLVLPEPLKVPAGFELPFAWVRVAGNRAYVSGHLPTSPTGEICEPLGKVGGAVSLEDAVSAARLAGLGVIASLNRELGGNLDRIARWLRVFGMVNCAPGFNKTTVVVNGFSQLILDVFGREIGLHSRSAVGMAELPFNVPVEFEAEVELA